MRAVTTTRQGITQRLSGMLMAPELSITQLGKRSTLTEPQSNWFLESAWMKAETLTRSRHRLRLFLCATRWTIDSKIRWAANNSITSISTSGIGIGEITIRSTDSSSLCQGWKPDSAFMWGRRSRTTRATLCSLPCWDWVGPTAYTSRARSTDSKWNTLRWWSSEPFPMISTMYIFSYLPTVLPEKYLLWHRSWSWSMDSTLSIGMVPLHLLLSAYAFTLTCWILSHFINYPCSRYNCENTFSQLFVG